MTEREEVIEIMQQYKRDYLAYIKGYDLPSLTIIKIEKIIQALSIPDTHVLVLRDPTKKMIKAAGKVNGFDFKYFDAHPVDVERAKEYAGIYKAMINSVPKE